MNSSLENIKKITKKIEIMFEDSPIKTCKEKKEADKRNNLKLKNSKENQKEVLEYSISDSNSDSGAETRRFKKKKLDKHAKSLEKFEELQNQLDSKNKENKKISTKYQKNTPYDVVLSVNSIINANTKGYVLWLDL